MKTLCTYFLLALFTFVIVGCTQPEYEDPGDVEEVQIDGLPGFDEDPTSGDGSSDAGSGDGSGGND